MARTAWWRTVCGLWLAAGLLASGVGPAAAQGPGELGVGSWTIVADERMPARPAGTQLPLAGSAVGTSPKLIAYIRQRMLSRVPDDIEPYFDVLLYVSRATEGPYAQRMYVFERREAGEEFEPYAQWLVSTGREQEEKHWTGTPDGIFKLDHRRFQKHRVSYQWGTPMPWTMFFDADFEGRRTGYAIHGASDPNDIAALGTRASAGCIRLHPRHAEAIFNKIRRETFGKVPVFPYDRFTDSTNLEGQALYRDDGRLVLTRGFRTLLMVENFKGAPTTAPATDAFVSAE